MTLPGSAPVLLWHCTQVDNYLGLVSMWKNLSTFIEKHFFVSTFHMLVFFSILKYIIFYGFFVMTFIYNFANSFYWVGNKVLFIKDIRTRCLFLILEDICPCYIKTFLFSTSNKKIYKNDRYLKDKRKCKLQNQSKYWS